MATYALKNLFTVVALSVLAQNIAVTAWAQPELADVFDTTRLLNASQIPSNLEPWLFYEQEVNNRDMGTVFRPLDHSALDARFDPMNRPVVEIGYLEIPVDEAWFRTNQSTLSEPTRNIMFFEKGGRQYIRFFIHPLMESKYELEARSWGQKYTDASGAIRGKPFHGDYVASLTSSLRSWVVWEKANPKNFAGQKTSLALVVQTDRKNDLDKLERAYAITLVADGIPAAIKNEFAFDFFREPIIQNTSTLKRGGKFYGNIVRDFGGEMVYSNGQPRFLPGFALTSDGPKGAPPVLIDLIARSGMRAEDYIRTNIVEPMIRSYAYLTFQQGIIGEPHQQNFLYELDESGQLTGHVMYRDLDAFKPDIELRHVLGLSDEPFSSPTRPYKLLKMGKAEEFYRTSYEWYVKSNWVQNIEKMMAKWGSKIEALALEHNPPSRLGVFGRLKRMLGRSTNEGRPVSSADHRIENLSNLYDQALLVEMVRYLGAEAVFNAGNMNHQRVVAYQEWALGKGHSSYSAETLKAEREKALVGTWSAFVAANSRQLSQILPGVRLDASPLEMSPEQAAVLLQHFPIGKIFLVDKVNSAGTFIFDVNLMIAKFKSMQHATPQSAVDQTVLRNEYERLQFNYRHSSVMKVPRNGFFVLNKGSITAYRSAGDILGHTFLEPRWVADTGRPYYEGSRYPRLEPNLAILRMLYDFADGKVSSIPAMDIQRYEYPTQTGAEPSGAVDGVASEQADACEASLTKVR